MIVTIMNAQGNTVERQRFKNLRAFQDFVKNYEYLLDSCGYSIEIFYE